MENNTQIFYSGKTGGFYFTEIHGESVPDDAVEIDRSEYESLLTAQSEGYSIVPDSNGFPILIEPPKPEPYIPTQVSRAQGKAALISAGLWDSVELYVAAISDPTEKALAYVSLNDTTHWSRTSPFLHAAATALDLTSKQVDDLFVAASKIEL